MTLEELMRKDEKKFKEQEKKDARWADKSAGPSFKGPKVNLFGALGRSPRNHPSSNG